MKPTGKFNPFTEEEILRVEEQDITFWEKTWEELTLHEKATFCSFIGIQYLASKGELKNDDVVERRYRFWRFTNKYNPQLDTYKK